MVAQAVDLSPSETDQARSLIGRYSSYLDPAPRAEIAALITRLRAHYYVPNMRPELAEAVAEDWANDLAEYPIWAVKAACDRYRRSEDTKPPKPAALRAFANDETRQLRAELKAMTRALNNDSKAIECQPVTAEQIGKIYQECGIKTDSEGNITSLGEAAEKVVAGT